MFYESLIKFDLKKANYLDYTTLQKIVNKENLEHFSLEVVQRYIHFYVKSIFFFSLILIKVNGFLTIIPTYPIVQRLKTEDKKSIIAKI